MAGERKGKTYEAILKVALDRLRAAGKIKGEIFWNKVPKGMTIEPDFTIGKDEDHPTHVLLVNHSSSAKNSDMKFWRNIGELAEAKLFLATVPRVYNIAFDSVIKEDLKKIQAAAFDGQLMVGDLSYGDALQEWVDQNHAHLPAKGDEKAEEIAKRAVTEKALNGLLGKLVADLEATLKQVRPELDQLWAMDRVRKPGKAPAAKDTTYRRGFTKSMVLGCAPIDVKKPISSKSDWLLKLGIVKKTLGGLRVTDSELLWVAGSPLASIGPSDWPADSISRGFRDQLNKVRSLALLDEFQRYVTSHLAELRTVKGMEAHIAKLHKDPSRDLLLPAGVKAPANVWLFDFIGALAKAKAGRSQAFGYSTFSKHPSSGKARIGNMDIGTWSSCFMNQYFSRRTGFHAPKEAVSFVAKVLSQELAKFSANEIASLAQKLEEQYIAKEYEATLLAHRGFDPIGGLIQLKAGLKPLQATRIQGAFAERAIGSGGSGATSVVKRGATIINWQSASDAGRDHKKKELCGRAIALRYSWNSTASRFVPRAGIKKLILVVDGTWTQSDLDALARAGWDEILYPDQMDKLTKAIV